MNERLMVTAAKIEQQRAIALAEHFAGMLPERVGFAARRTARAAVRPVATRHPLVSTPAPTTVSLPAF